MLEASKTRMVVVEPKFLFSVSGTESLEDTKIHRLLHGSLVYRTCFLKRNLCLHFDICCVSMLLTLIQFQYTHIHMHKHTPINSHLQ